MKIKKTIYANFGEYYTLILNLKMDKLDGSLVCIYIRKKLQIMF